MRRGGEGQVLEERKPYVGGANRAITRENTCMHSGEVITAVSSYFGA
jgi:hypothetical protein